MARPVSWLPRLDAIARSVAGSARSHYASSDLERLFEIQPRSAQMLLGLLPTVRIGKSLLVEREALADMLERLRDAKDPAAELARLRARPRPVAVRRKLRDLQPRDIVGGAAELPANVAVERGFLGIRFGSMEELADALYRLAAVLEADLEGFAERYEPEATDGAGQEDEDERERADAAFIREWMANQ
jgi:hypothetical protein